MEHSQSNSGLDQCHNRGVRRKQVANPTTNYGFVLPTPTDLVTDLPADFDVALQGVDTRLKALNPSTTLGDTEYASATANTNTRLAIGSTGQVLTVAGGVPSWATPSGSSATYTLLNAGGTALTGAATITISGISNVENIFVFITNGSTSGTNSFIGIRLNGVTTGSYSYFNGMVLGTSTWGTANIIGQSDTTETYFPIGRTSDDATSVFHASCQISACKTTGFKMMQGQFGANSGGGAGVNNRHNTSGGHLSTTTITSVSLFTSTGNFDAGTMYVYATS